MGLRDQVKNLKKAQAYQRDLLQGSQEFMKLSNSGECIDIVVARAEAALKLYKYDKKYLQALLSCALAKSHGLLERVKEWTTQ